MDWVKWLIPLVVVFVIILSNLARIAQEEKKNSPRRRPGPGDNPPRPRGPQTDAERFLEEINRRRREAAAQRNPPVAQRAPAPPRRPPAERAPRRETPTATQEMPSVVPPTPRRAVPVPTPDAAMPSKRQLSPKPADPERRKPTPLVEEVVVATLVPATTQSGNVTAGAPAAIIAVKPDTPTTALLRQLLRNPQSLKAAVVLREVLESPLCRRPPRVAPRVGQASRRA